MWSVIADERVRQPKKKTRLQREQWLNELFKDCLWCDQLFLKKVFKVVTQGSAVSLETSHNFYICKYHLCIGALKNSSTPRTACQQFFLFVCFLPSLRVTFIRVVHHTKPHHYLDAQLNPPITMMSLPFYF